MRTRKTLGILSAMVSAVLLLGLSVSPTDAATFKVKCDKGQSIQERLDNNAQPGDTVEVSGTCFEHVLIATHGVTLRCVDNITDSITAPDMSASTVGIVAQNVVLDGCRVTGGRNGVSVRNGASAVVKNNVVTGNGSVGTAPGNHGVSITNGAWAEVANNIITFNRRRGVFVFSGAGADIHGNTIDNNGLDGIGVFFNAYAGIATVSNPTSNFIRNNGTMGFGRGIVCRSGGSINLSNQNIADITGNDAVGGASASCPNNNAAILPLIGGP